MMPRHARLRTALSSALPVLAVAVLALFPPALAGVLPRSVPSAVLLAQGVRAWRVFHRLGRTRSGS
ncbi:hypothetical protein ACFWIQ_08740 [Kitasatospora sp. NPDC127059]|uniref:hypothetical protein n=1 Tax=unclassified Kitasatospora TaxID=2633591 RepID=UPI00366319DA